MEQEMKTIWLRVGMSYTGTQDEIEKILRGDADLPDLEHALQNGDARLDGETYIPSFVVEDYNASEKTNFPVGDIDWYL